jgi:hypothetical protein
MWRRGRSRSKREAEAAAFVALITTVIVVILVHMSSVGKLHGMANGKNASKRLPPEASSSSVRGKSAEDILLESFGELIDSAADKMNEQEFREAERASNGSLARALARPKRRRETA